jgi:exopolysaccharide production protein ExoQ
MSRPIVALVLCLPFIWWLWRRDIQARPKFSRTFWIPVFWLLILGSRPLSWWLGVGGSSDNLEGNWFDRLLYLGLIFVAIYILSNRRISWGTLIQQNKALLLFYCFLLATVLWAPYPFVAFKRWFKDIGAIFIILLILTEEDPLEATKALFARCAFVWFPLSEIFAKYFPSIGREYSHSGGTMYSGVTSQKNSLGALILVVGLVLVSELFQSNRPLRGRPLKGGRFTRFLNGHHFTILITLAMGLWLLLLCQSRTSQICFIIGTVIVLSHKIPALKDSPRRVLLLSLIAVPMFFITDTLFGVSDQLLALMGRNPTLTGRTEIWEAIKKKPVDPIIGLGYLMYWDYYGGVEMDRLRTARTSHNGYIDIYLDGGALGLFFLAVMLLAVGTRVAREFLIRSEYGRLAFAIFVATLLYNVSESTYARRSPLWFAFLLFALEFRGYLPSIAPVETDISEDSWIKEREPVGVVDG